MLTVDYDRLDLRPGMTVLDLGCGEGRHAFEAYRRGASVIAVDWGRSEVETTKRWLGAIAEAGEAGRAGDGMAARFEVVRGDLTALPVPEAELVDLLQRATVVAIPSLYEGFSLPALEAMACATPLVTTDAGALPEVVGSEAGLRVRAGDVGELTAALQLVLDSPSLADQLGRAGRRRVLESYTWRSTAQRTADWYAETLERKGRPC